MKENILKLRKDFKLSQEDLAEKVGVTRQTISNWELGETQPNVEQLKKLSEVFKVSIDDLVGNDVSGILVEKISNTEKLAGIIIKVLKVIGIIFIVLLVIDIISLILFSAFKSNYSVSKGNTQVNLKCNLNEENYNYTITYDKDDSILKYSGSDYISNIIDGQNFLNGSDMIEYIENYFENNGGNC